MTPHNQAKKDEIAKIVLMPGDPLRAKYIATHYLTDIHCFNTVRNMLGYTGLYQGRTLSIMGSGMGMPSIGIYSYELYTQYDVDTIIRIGSCGALIPSLDLFDVILADSAWSRSTYAQQQSHDANRIQYPSLEINQALKKAANEQNQWLHPCRFHSSDVFYYEAGIDSGALANQCAVVEMESFALFHNAKVTGKKAACLCTVSDSLVTHQETTAQQRETAFDTMAQIALGGSLYV